MAVDGISEEEAVLYDRQIRLWGHEAQSRLKQADVLIIGVSGTTCEIAKNIVLAGIKSLKYFDETGVSSAKHQKFILVKTDEAKRLSDAVLERTRELNPMVAVSAVSEQEFEDTVRNSSIVVVAETTDGLLDKVEKVKSLMRDDALLLATASFGSFAFAFYDFGRFDFVSEDAQLSKDANANAVGETQALSKKHLDYTNMRSFFSLNLASPGVKPPTRLPKGFFVVRLLHYLNKPASSLTQDVLEEGWAKLHSDLGVPSECLSKGDFERMLEPSGAALSAVMGGLMAQEIIQAICRKGHFNGNWCFFDCESCAAVVDWYPPNQQTV